MAAWGDSEGGGGASGRGVGGAVVGGGPGAFLSWLYANPGVGAAANANVINPTIKALMVDLHLK